MFKTLLSFLFVLSLIAPFSRIYAESFFSPLPPELIILNLHDDPTRWKEISRYVSDQEGLVEYIPIEQSIGTWNELICFQHFASASMKPSSRNSIKGALDLLREGIVNPKEKQITWNVIEQNKSDALYEWIQSPLNPNQGAEHEVSRVFVTDKGFYRVGFTRKGREMSAVERERCIQLLKNSASLVSTNKAQIPAGGLSILDRLKDSVLMGDIFNSWKILYTYSFENGYTIVGRAPPHFKGGYLSECLEVLTMPNVNALSLNQLVEAERVKLREKLPKTEFRTLKRTTKEIIYSCVYPQDGLQVTAITRTFLTDQGYYSIVYKHGQQYEMKPVEIEEWKNRLEGIQVY